MLKKTKLCTGLMVACGGVLLSAGSASFAQPAPAPAPAPQSLERVEITGSNIRRADAETAAPVQVITKQEIDQAGKGTIAEYLQTLTADGQGSVPFTYGRGFSGATSAGISLRGLGANATLVLVNGRRLTTAVLADDAQRTYVDLNQIPMEAVDRIEVLKDGASAIYGSDAVAGVVNIILRKNFVGTIGKVSYGQSGNGGDGKEPRGALTFGTGDLNTDGYNLLLNGELGKKEAIYYRDRVGRGSVGVSAVGQPQWGFDPNAVSTTNNIPRNGGNGTIPVNNVTGVRVNNTVDRSIIGNVRNPSTLDYYSRSDPGGVGFTRAFPNAATYCAANANLPQNSVGGGCINDQWQQMGQVQPTQENGSFYGRFTKQVTPDIQAFVEASAAYAKTSVDLRAVTSNAAYFTPDGTSNSRTATGLIGASHPDNPYFGTAARLSYLPLFDTGVPQVNSKSHTERILFGAQGTWNQWDFDTAVLYSGAHQTDTTTKTQNWRVANALLNPTATNVAAATAFSPAYAALPAGTLWRIGENAGLNSPEMYNALLADQDRSGYSKLYGADFKVSREVGKLEGGAIGVAVGAEVRREDNYLPFYNGLGDYAGLSLTTYGGARNIYAGYGEVILPVLKNLELGAALRYDYYTDAGSALTPKFGAKWKPIENLALRGTYAKAFRAPSSPENVASSVAAFGGPTVDDTKRCAALTADGVAPGTVTANCRGVGPTFIQRGNPDLQPEKSTSTTLGLVWDITARASLTADIWQIKRKGLPVLQDAQVAVDNDQVARDPATAISANDPGAILNGFVTFENSASSTTNGFDVEAKGRWLLNGNNGQVTTGANWTHLITQSVTDQDGTVHNYAGTHGNCDITNCIGSPRDRVSLYATWEIAAWRLGANVNYRSSISNKFEQADADCAQTTLAGAEFPGGCKVKSFTTLDMSAAWKFGKNSEIFGSIQNVFDTKPPVDFLTYGAIGYNPLDYAGAIGRFFRIGVKHQF